VEEIEILGGLSHFNIATSKHKVSPKEVEEALFENDPYIRSWSGVYHAYGRTQAGRYLFVVFAQLGRRQAQIITARDMTLRERRLYRAKEDKMAKVKEEEEKKLPDFSKMTLEEIAKFWDTHDSADYWDQMEEVDIDFKRRLDRTVTIKIASSDLERLKRIARERDIGHTTLIRSWIKEKLRELEGGANR
jgi:hypothetical protein